MRIKEVDDQIIRFNTWGLLDAFLSSTQAASESEQYGNLNSIQPARDGQLIVSQLPIPEEPGGCRRSHHDGIVAIRTTVQKEAIQAPCEERQRVGIRGRYALGDASLVRATMYEAKSQCALPPNMPSAWVCLGPRLLILLGCPSPLGSIAQGHPEPKKKKKTRHEQTL